MAALVAASVDRLGRVSAMGRAAGVGGGARKTTFKVQFFTVCVEEHAINVVAPDPLMGVKAVGKSSKLTRPRGELSSGAADITDSGALLCADAASASLVVRGATDVAQQ